MAHRSCSNRMRENNSPDRIRSRKRPIRPNHHPSLHDSSRDVPTRDDPSHDGRNRDRGLREAVEQLAVDH